MLVSQWLPQECWPLQWQRGDPVLIVSHLVVSGFVCRLGLLLVCKCSYMVEPRPFAAVVFFWPICLPDSTLWLPFFCQHQVNSHLLTSHLFDIIYYTCILSLQFSTKIQIFFFILSPQAQSVFLLCSCSWASDKKNLIIPWCNLSLKWGGTAGVLKIKLLCISSLVVTISSVMLSQTYRSSPTTKSVKYIIIMSKYRDCRIWNRNF